MGIDKQILINTIYQLINYINKNGINGFLLLILFTIVYAIVNWNYE